MRRQVFLKSVLFRKWPNGGIVKERQRAAAYACFLSLFVSQAPKESFQTHLLLDGRGKMFGQFRNPARFMTRYVFTDRRFRGSRRAGKLCLVLRGSASVIHGGQG
jgi:hypothetical protein